MQGIAGGVGRGAVALCAIAATLAFTASASAESVTGGKTVLKADAATFEGLADMSIGVEPTGNARSTSKGFKFRINGGDLNNGRGEITHGGGLAFFTEGGAGLKVSKFRVKIGPNKAKVFARSSGAEIRFMNLDLGNASAGGTDSLIVIKGARAKLATPGAELLSSTFDFPFRTGIPLGEMKIKASLSGSAD